MSTLILTEKPSVARDFANALNIPARGDGLFSSKEFVITWAIGHLYVPCDPENYEAIFKKWSLESLPILPNQFLYKANKNTKKQLNIVLKILNNKKIKKLIVATDAGREGELIARTILAHSSFSGESYRFWTSDALTPKVINNQMKKLRPLSEFNRLYYAGKARQMADWLIGMNLTRAVSVIYGDLFSVGRVQTAVLSLLVKRKNEINNFKPTPYFSLEGLFNFSNKEIKAKWFNPALKENADWIETKEKVNILISKCDQKDVSVEKAITNRKISHPPHLYSLTELQKQANRSFGFSASKTLSLAQELYEKYKCLSYPRTDSVYLGTSTKDLVDELVTSLREVSPSLFNKFDNNKLSLSNKRIFNDQGLTDHHALIPLAPFSGARRSDQEKIYQLVLKRFCAALSRDYIYDETKIILNCSGELFRTRGKVVIEQGFKEILGEEKDQIIPSLNPNEKGLNISLNSENKETKPPAHYTEASLLHHMGNPSGQLEDKSLRNIFQGHVGLGTQSTRASIIETLLKRIYIKREVRLLIATTKGEHLISFLAQGEYASQLAKADETAKWEASLEEVANGNLSLGKEFVENMKSYTSSCIDELKNSKKLDYKPQKQSENENIDVKTSQSDLGQCPLCKGNMVETNKAFGCENWRSGCNATIWKKMSGKNISQTQVKKIIRTGKSDKLKGFKSKQGKVFDARIILTDKGVSFEF